MEDIDPTMPKRMPIGAKRAIEQITSYRSWSAIDVYSALREALQKPHEVSAGRSDAGIGEAARAGVTTLQKNVTRIHFPLAPCHA